MVFIIGMVLLQRAKFENVGTDEATKFSFKKQTKILVVYTITFTLQNCI